VSRGDTVFKFESQHTFDTHKFLGRIKTHTHTHTDTHTHTHTHMHAFPQIKILLLHRGGKENRSDASEGKRLVSGCLCVRVCVCVCMCVFISAVRRFYPQPNTRCWDIYTPSYLLWKCLPHVYLSTGFIQMKKIKVIIINAPITQINQLHLSLESYLCWI